MNFIKDYMTNTGQIPETEEQKIKHLVLAEVKNRAETNKNRSLVKSFDNCI